MAIIGIDLGTTNSLAAYWSMGRAVMIPDETGEVLIPSAVGKAEGRGILVGRAAKERLLTHGEDTAVSFKRFMGTEKEYSMGGKSYTPMELSAMVLEKIKRNAESFLKEEIEEAVITVPAYFNDKQRSDTKKAAQIAGLTVERLINEPSAAALAYRMQYGEEDKSLLIFDFGGGTLDLSYVECFDNIIEIIAVAGDNYLGGDDIDRLIAEYFCKQNLNEKSKNLNGEACFEELSMEEKAALIHNAENAKRRLEQEKEVTLSAKIGDREYSVLLNDDLLFEICMPLFSKIKQLFIHILEDAGAHVSDIDDLIMVGGSSRLTVVRRFLTELLRKEPVLLGDTDKVVAMGAGVYAGIRQRNEDIRDMLLTDVCPFTLGVGTRHRKEDKQGVMLPMIERNSTLPAVRQERLYTLYDFQKTITVKIYQGEEYYTEDNIYLGEVTVNVEPRRAGEEWIDVSFAYDINGILHVEIVNSQNEHHRVLFANQNLSEAELAGFMKEMEQILLPPIQQEKNRELLRQAMEYYKLSTGSRRQWIGSLIDQFVYCLNSGRRYLIRKAATEMQRQMEILKKMEETKEDILFDGELKWELDEDKEEELQKDINEYLEKHMDKEIDEDGEEQLQEDGEEVKVSKEGGREI